MLRRKAMEDLQNFYDSDEKKCLMVQGARQVGKTYLIRKFGEEKSPDCSFIEINFLKQPSMKAIFSGNLDVDTLLLNFSIYLPDAQFLPGHTILMLDEIQECPEAITSLKFWAEDNRFKVIATGSMLGIDYKRPSSYPVGSIRYLQLHALDFQEFLWANHIPDNLLTSLQKLFIERKPVPEAIHSQMMQYLQLYMILGGMPAVVNAYLEHHSVADADAIQRAILQDYRYDIAHYAAPDVKIKAEECYFSLPDQLSKPNHKFQYSKVEKGGSHRKFGSSIDWIIHADLVTPVHDVTKIEFPLRSFLQEDNFRLYTEDIGLLLGMYDYSMKAALLTEVSDPAVSIGQTKGGIYEALICDMLSKNNHELYFYRNDTTKVEIEFLYTSPDGVIPVEVKAKNNRSRSLDRILTDSRIPYGYKLVSGNLGVTGKKVTLPLYMAMFL